MTNGEITFGVITIVLAVVAIVISIISFLAAKRSANAADRSAGEAARSNDLAQRTAERQRFIWWIEGIPGTHGHMTYVLHNDGTDDAEVVTLTAGPVDPGMVAPDFRSLPNGITVHAHGSHEFYCDPAMAEVLPRQMMLSWLDQAPRPITLPSR